MFEIVNVENGMVLNDEHTNKYSAIKWAAAWSDSNGYDYIEINAADKLITIHKNHEEND